MLRFESVGNTAMIEEYSAAAPEMTTRQKHAPCIEITSPRVGVVVPIRNSHRTIKRCLQSLLEQQYPRFQIYVVADSLEPHATWDGLGDLALDPRLTLLEWSRPADWRGRDGNTKREYGATVAIAQDADIVAFIDSQVEAPVHWLSTAVDLLEQTNVDGLAGVSNRNPNDKSLAAIYQDSSLFSEWPRYGRGSSLSRDNVGKARQLPVTANLMVRSEALRAIASSWPRACPYGWEDFYLDHALLDSGAALLCTNQSRVYRLHIPKFRLAKHVTAGMAAAEFHRTFPQDSFVRRRLAQAMLVMFVGVGAISLLAAALFLQSSVLLFATAMSILLTLVVLGAWSTYLARDWRAVCFPLLDAVHIGSWIAGLSIALVGSEQIKDGAQRYFTARR